MSFDFPPDAELIERAVDLARSLQERAAECQTASERRQQAELDRMLQTPADKATLVQLTDQAFRAKTPARIVEQFTHILDVQGVPRFFSPFERALLRGFQTFGGWLPGVSAPLVKEHMQHETANVVIPAEPEVLTAHLLARHEEGVRMNLNFLGEALLGEAEAQRRIDRYLEALRMPEIECLSVKISTMYSQISALAREHTVRVLCDRLEPLYREAARLRYQLLDGSEVPKFIYLDMEEYRDMRLTAEVFQRTLDRPGMENVHAGIALQAYVPDSARVLRELQDWARGRVAKGGSPVTVRLVKGANLEMERVEATLRGWPQAPFKSKIETDANYKGMLYCALQPRNLAAVRIGVASHNLFDVAFGLVVAQEAGAADRVQFEMLEGMANHQRRALFEQTRHLLLYAPACRKEEFLNAIGYLIRRLDENTGPENFLRHAFRLQTGSEEWKTLEAGFRAAFHIGLSDAPRRSQNRAHPLALRPRPEMPWQQFVNEPDTDFSLPQNSAWAEQIVGEPWPPPATVPLVVDGESIFGNRLVDCLDPSRRKVVADAALKTQAEMKGSMEQIFKVVDGELIFENRLLDSLDPARRKVVMDAALKALAEMKGANTFKTQLTIEGLQDSIVGKSAAMQQVFKMVGRVSHSDAPVMITGESGSGKELVARAIHHYSQRSSKGFVAVNCAATPEQLLESELFGHEKGAFTDARVGQFEQSNGGSLFLNEIGDMTLALQGKILRVLQEGEFSRVGGNESLRTDVRIIAATTKNLEEEVSKRNFREDLFHRLNVVRIQLPPLRQRTEDIRLLAEYFLQKVAIQKHLPRLKISEEAARVLEAYAWPGNVRELANAIQRACVLATSDLLTPKDLPLGSSLPTESGPGEVIARCAQASPADIARAVECAQRDADGWRRRGAAERSRTLGAVAQELRNARATLVRAALANGGKTIAESDPEVSEAVDFVEFYRSAASSFYDLPGVNAQPKGVVVVVSPWNFPIAIPCGGVAAALAAGNCVILKPSSDAVLIAWELCQCFWRGGVSRRSLQFLPCSGADAGRWLVSRPEVDAVILTGGTETALAMLESHPSMPLYAETGGKNATIVTALSDREQAIKHVIHSAFSHSGQKCSATSLLLLEAEVYDDPGFKEIFCDAVESMRVGSAWDLETRMGPLIRPPSGALATALASLEPGESWAVQPQPIEGNPNLWSPGVKWGVQPGSVTHLTEFFGPLLGVMRFTRLEEAIGWVNQTGYGLTSGLESLDDREQKLWMDGIRAGNLYINKPTTGAIVLRQPFGGMGKSSFGPGMKAGGPNYVAQFMHFADAASSAPDEPVANPCLEDLRRRLLAVELDADPGEVRRALAAISSYDSTYREEFGRKHDHFRLLGEDNFRRYLPVSEMRIRVAPGDSFFEVFGRACAGQAAGCRVIVSSPPGEVAHAVQMLEDTTASWAGRIEFVTESDEQLAEAIRSGHAERIRYAAPERAPLAVRSAAHHAGAQIIDTTVLAEGRVELLWCLHEQSVSHAYHRYGNLGARAPERRAEPL